MPDKRSKRVFRILLVLTVACALLSGVISTMEQKSIPTPLRNYIVQRNATVLSKHFNIFAAEAVAFLVLFATSFVGLFLFWAPSRVLYVGLIFASDLMALDPSYSPFIETRWAAFWGGLCTALCGIVLYMAFTSPIREQFNTRRKMRT